MSDLEKDNAFPTNSSAKSNFIVKRVRHYKDEDPDASALKSLFKIALETRNFEISMLVQRNNFFMIFQGVLFAGVVQSSHEVPVVSFIVSLAGFLVSAYQVKMAAGAKFWQECWEETLKKVEVELVAAMNSNAKRRKTFFLFHDESNVYHAMVKERLNSHGCSLINNLILRRYSVSRVPIYVAIVLAAIWFVLMLCTLQEYPPLSVPSFIVGFKGFK